MKKVLLLTCMALTTLVAMAQTKKVAILETVDREGRLSYNQKLMLRSNMARAVSNTTGYEAYDRSDVDMIMSEQDFQRTGLVSDAEIRKLGEMTGVSLILVTEGVLTGDGKIFVSAKILNVETAKVEMMDNTSMGVNSDAIQEGCSTLAKRLFGITASSNAMEKYNIEQFGVNEYTYMGKYMSSKEYEIFLRNNCPKAYHQYKTGKAMVISGWSACGAGLILFIPGIIYSFDSGTKEHHIGYSLIGFGIPLMASGAVVASIGHHKRNTAYKVYNNTCASSSATPITFNLTAGKNGLGLAINF